MTASEGPTLAPDLAALLEELSPADRSGTSPQQQRAEYGEFVEMLRGPESTFTGDITEHTVTNTASGQVVPIRRYSPDKPTDPDHVLLYFHGGGWVLGNLHTHDRFPRAIAQQLGLEVVAVDYRLAPEHPFPAAFDDCVTVVDHIAQTAKWIGLCGDSAGGNLAAAVSADRAAVAPVDAQILIYPGLSVPSEVPDRTLDGLGLDRDDIDYFWSSYRSDNHLDARLAPLLHPDPIPAPPTLVTTAGFDPLRRDGVNYATRLADADVAVTYLPFPQLVHGWLELAEAVGSAHDARQQLIDAIGVLHHSSAPRGVQRRP